MLTIRLQRTGAKNRADFRIVLAQSYRAVGKKFLEVLGHYNPRSKNFGIKDEERLKHWLAENVSLSPTVRNLLIEKKLLEGKKVKAWRPKRQEATETAPAAATPASEAKTVPTSRAVEAPTEASPSAGVDTGQ